MDIAVTCFDTGKVKTSDLAHALLGTRGGRSGVLLLRQSVAAAADTAFGVVVNVDAGRVEVGLDMPGGYRSAVTGSRLYISGKTPFRERDCGPALPSDISVASALDPEC